MGNNDELVDIVIEKIRAGESKNKIIVSLKEEGWLEEDVEKAISHIKKAAVRRLPIVSPFFKFIDDIESKGEDLSTGKLIAIIAVLSIFVLLIGVGLYMAFDPLNTKVVVENVSVPNPAPVIPAQEGTMSP